MKNLLFAIFICAVVFAGGCGRQNQRTIDNKQLLEGVTLDAIQPDHQIVPDLAQHHFSVHIFEMPAQNFRTAEQIFALLDTQNLHVVNEDVFRSNGFDIGIAGDQLWPQIAQMLASVNAREQTIHNVIITEDAGHDIRASASRRPKRFHYINLASESVDMTLKPGELVWRIQARDVPQQRGQALVRIEAVFKKFMGTVLSKLPEHRQKNEQLFDFSRIRMRINEGEFAILGPSKYDQQAGDLASLYFNTHADFLMPVEAQSAKDANTAGKPRYEMQRDIQLIRLYLIYCDRVDSQ